ncbi:hypothetical protein [Daejeonella lutea]|uniref:Uncharacterized protein n=1 Tax=Daejeonella lutea TaxID=572036 RepID=A0A1T5EYR6_9SPHI|nr:hypothetical protein [Daejeonella lutea]SKB88840.1 hypothetical protein SAMN05661099_3283 [Daejeonella lutea]
MVLIDKSETGRIPKWGLFVFPFLTIIFAGFYLLDESLYRYIIKEDSIVEWLTFAFLFAAGILSLIVAIRIKHTHQYLHWFFILFFGFNILAGLEEISWGQRVFHVETTGVFHEYSDQNEINLHNTFQGIFHIKTKHIALLVLFLYGSILPGLMRDRNWQNENFVVRQFIVPPMFLRGGFTIGAILMLDFQTGHEEEIGEFFFSICFFIMMLWNLTLFKRGYFRPDSYISISKRTPSLSE